MNGPAAPDRVTAFRGSILHFSADPGHGEASDAATFVDDGLLVLRNGCVERVGPAHALLGDLPVGTPVTDYGAKLILPGFIDTHVHFAQTDMIASYSPGLLDWLERYTYPAERRFGDPVHAREVAAFFADELLRNGTTAAMVFGTVHAESVHAMFEAAQARGMRLIAGKAMMDRNAPEFLRDTPESGYADSAALIGRWHGQDRLLYAVTPRFAATSSERQLELAARLLDEHPGVYLQSHVAENVDEVAWIRELFPWSRSYIDVYDRYRLLRPRAVYAHCIHLDDTDRRRLGESGTAASFCPTSNLFLGSGLFDHAQAAEHGIRTGLGTDVGGGTSFSMIRTMHEAYKVSQLAGRGLTPLRAFYLATLGGAEALHLDDRLGSFTPGKEGDFVVLDWQATPLMARRMARAGSLAERLFVLMMLGDDRAVAATHIMGTPAYVRDTVG